MTGDRLHDDVASLLRGGDHRYTTGRKRVITALSLADGPVTIPQLLALEPSLAQSSAYRNLAILQEVGAVERIVTHDDHARYELAEALTEDHHHHLICTTCGMVRDFELPDEIERSLEGAAQTTAASADFRVEGHRIDLLGSCTVCA